MRFNFIFLLLSLSALMACAQIAARNERLQNYGTTDYHLGNRLGRRAAAQLDLDDKTKARVNEAFKSVIENDDKKAKLAYGRSYKHMPEFIQFAFDLRFKNYEHAKELLSQLPYKENEKAFWSKIIESKPKVVSKVICDELTVMNFSYPVEEALSQELSWYVDIQEVVDELYKNVPQKSGQSPLEEVFAKLSLRDTKGNIVPLSKENQKFIFNESFFNDLRNAQRRDTRAWLSLYATPLKAWSYKRGFKPPQAYDLYESLSTTEAAERRHFLYRLKGIIKDMRFESLTLRVLGSKTIEDSDDLKKAENISLFKGRYPVIATFLNLETTLADCNLINKKE